MAEWLTLTEAAHRLGWHPRKLESRARREGWQRRPANRGRAGEYLIPDELLAPSSPSAARRGDVRDGANGGVNGAVVSAELAELRDLLEEERTSRVEAVERAAKAEGELAAEMRRNAELVTELREMVAAERARADRLEATLAEARKPALVRLLEALRRR
jgi:hypothetical protein